MNRKSSTAGVWLFGLASTVSGLLDLDWGSFDPSSQPIRAFSGKRPPRFVGVASFARILYGICTFDFWPGSPYAYCQHGAYGSEVATAGSLFLDRDQWHSIPGCGTRHLISNTRHSGRAITY